MCDKGAGCCCPSETGAGFGALVLLLAAFAVVGLGAALIVHILIALAVVVGVAVVAVAAFVARRVYVLTRPAGPRPAVYARQIATPRRVIDTYNTREIAPPERAAIPSRNRIPDPAVIPVRPRAFGRPQ